MSWAWAWIAATWIKVNSAERYTNRFAQHGKRCGGLSTICSSRQPFQADLFAETRPVICLRAIHLCVESAGAHPSWPEKDTNVGTSKRPESYLWCISYFHQCWNNRSGLLSSHNQMSSDFLHTDSVWISSPPLECKEITCLHHLHKSKLCSPICSECVLTCFSTLNVQNLD